MNKIVNKDEAVRIISSSENEFAVINNPDFLFPGYDIYPLAGKITSPSDQLVAVLMDMDGTTTTTEELCIHSLEYMIRRLSNKMEKTDWEGLNHVKDYPFIIGNSTTKHVEFLIGKYQYMFKEEGIKSYFYAILWTLLKGKDEKRKADVKNNMANLKLDDILTDQMFIELNENNGLNGETGETITDNFYNKYKNRLSNISFNDYVRMGIDIYYQRYHQILERIRQGEGEVISKEIFNNKDKHLIEPMPAIEIFLPLIKGWLGTEAGNLSKDLISAYEKKSGIKLEGYDDKIIREILTKLSRIYESHPMKSAIVTSSIFYEADIVINEVFKLIKSKIAEWNISESRKKYLMEKFSNYRNVYDAVVTASDTNEIRLKPHRDLYSIGLFQLGIRKEDFSKVAGFEDSESGTIAIRASGIGRCVAVPFAQTSGHDFQAAAFVCPGGLAEVILKNDLFTRIDKGTAV